MRKDWEVKKLGEICLSIKDGSHNPPKGIESGSYLMLSSQNIQDGYIDFKNSRFISEDDFRKEQKRVKVKKGDLLLTIVGTIGRSCVFDGSIDNIVFQRSVAVLTPKVDIVPFFLRYFIKSKKTLLENEAKGVAQKGIYLKQLSDFKISVPPLQIQQQIVEELDCLTSIIEKQKKQLEELDNLAQSVFYDMFGDPIENDKGWNRVKFSDIGNVRGGYAFKSSSFVDSGIPILKIGNINSGYFKKDNISFYKYDSSLRKYEVYPNDLVLSMTGTVGKEDYGNICTIPFDYELYYLNQRNAKLIINDSYNRLFLSYVLKDNKVKYELTKNSKGVRQANISNSDILNLNLISPPLPLQQQFAAKIEVIEKQKELIKKSIKETEDLFNSRMDYYFN